MLDTLIFILLGWIAGVLINHAGNVLPLKESLLQMPFCKRRLDDGPEAISTAHKDADSAAMPEPVYCHSPRPLAAWSALAAVVTGNQTCAACGKSIGVRALIIEVLTPALFVALGQSYAPGAYLALLLAYTMILLVLLVTDLEHRLIQNVVILPAVLLALAGSFASPLGWKRAILGGALGFVVFYALAWIARGGLGEGDVTLATFLGLVIGLPNIIIALIYGIFLGGLVSVVLLASRKVTLKTFIPYGPFLIVTGWVVMGWGNALASWIWR